MSARAGIVVTGTEVLTGRIQDRNGPWLSDRLLELGVELAHITICGDRPEDIDAQLRFLADQDVDLILTSGGLGPTADDMTVEMVARFCERELVLDDELEEKIAGILKPLMARFSHWDFDAVRAANRKQALVPEGAFIIDPVGTAPGVVVPGKPTVVVLPGPPRELQPMWRTAVNTDAVLEAIAGRTTYLHETVRMFGLPESGLADTLRDAEEGIAGFEALEITTCLRRGEIEMVTRYEPDAADVYAELVSLVRERHGREIFSDDGSRVDDLVARAPCGTAGRHGGVVHLGTAGRAPDGASGVVRLRGGRRGGLRQRGEGGAARRGPAADRGARRRVGAGRRGHGRGRAEAASGPTRRWRSPASQGPTAEPRRSPWAPCAGACGSTDGRGITRTVRLPGDRADIRDRSTTVAMHLLLRLLSE